MHGISIDDDPDRPIGTKPLRRAVAIHWKWTTEYTIEEIANALGVRERTIKNYLSEPPSDDVKAVMNDVEAEVRMVAVAELKDQLQRAGDRSKTAEKPVEIYENDSGDVVVKNIEDDAGNVVKKIPKVQDIRMLPDEESRFYARKEVREIIDQLVDLVGAGEPEEVEVEHSGTLFDLPPEVTDHWGRDDGDDE
jgi:predicted transcriptional regulator